MHLGYKMLPYPEAVPLGLRPLWLRFTPVFKQESGSRRSNNPTLQAQCLLTCLLAMVERRQASEPRPRASSCPESSGDFLGDAPNSTSPTRQRGWKAALEFPSESPRLATSPMARGTRSPPWNSSPAFAPENRLYQKGASQAPFSPLPTTVNPPPHPEDFGSATGERQIFYPSPFWLQESPSFLRPSAGILHAPRSRPGRCKALPRHNLPGTR